jgi:hypothetical protein
MFVEYKRKETENLRTVMPTWLNKSVVYILFTLNQSFAGWKLENLKSETLSGLSSRKL